MRILKNPTYFHFPTPYKVVDITVIQEFSILYFFLTICLQRASSSILIVKSSQPLHKKTFVVYP